MFSEPGGIGKFSIHLQYEPQQGAVMLDNLDVADYDHQIYHDLVSVVDQEPILFGGTPHSFAIHPNLGFTVAIQLISNSSEKLEIKMKLTQMLLLLELLLLVDLLLLELLLLLLLYVFNHVPLRGRKAPP